MQVNVYKDPAGFYNPTQPENAPKADASSSQSTEIKPSGNQKQTGSLKSDSNPSKPAEESGAANFMPDPLSRVKRNTNSENEQPRQQSTPLHSAIGSPAIALIDVDPTLFSSAMQGQFENFYRRAKFIKDNSPPDLRSQASNFIRDVIKNNTNQDIDPDKTFVSMFAGAEALQDGNDGVTGFQHKNNEMKESTTLTDFILKNYNGPWKEDTSDVLNMYFGLYKNNSDANTYGASNEIKILPSDLRKMFKEGDLEQHMIQKQDSFWSTCKPTWRTLAKTEFCSLAKKAVLDGQLTKNGYELAMNGGASNVPLKEPAKILQMASEANPDPSAQVRRLDINGYSATDILRFSGQDGREVLYIPGEKQSFYDFENENALKDWVVGQTQDPVARQELASHFSIYDRSKGNWGIFSKTGVDEGFDNLASKKWDRNSIDLGAETIGGDVFHDMAERTEQRNKEDLLQISNNDDKRKIWLDDLKNSGSAPFIKPIGRALSAGNFAASVGAEGGQAFVSRSMDERNDFDEAAGMNVALSLLFAPSALASSSKPVPPRRPTAPISGPAVNSSKQQEFKIPEFPPGNATEAANEINDAMGAIAGPQNVRQYDSLSSLEKSADSPEDKLRFQRVKNSLEEVFNRLNASNNRLHDPAEKSNVLKALESSLNTTNDRALTQAYDRLANLSAEALSRFRLFRDSGYNNTTFFERLDKSKPLPENEGPPVSAFVNLKDRKRIMINLEGPDEGCNKLSQSEAGQRYNVELVDSIMNQLARIVDNAQNFVSVKRKETKDGSALGTAKMALEQFLADKPGDSVCRQVLGKEPDYLDDPTTRNILGMQGEQPVSDFARATARYKYNGMPENERKNIEKTLGWTYSDQEKQTALDKIQQDDILRSDLMTSNADTATIYLRDIGGKRNYDTHPVFDYFLEVARKAAPSYIDEKGVRELADKLLNLELKYGSREFNYYHNGKNTAGYAVEDAYGKLHVFPTRAEADQFQNGHVFWQTVGKKAQNPLGSAMEMVAHAAGASEKTKERLYEIGGNPLGKSWGLVGKYAGASPETQEKIEKAGGYAEYAIPVWGQARFYAGLTGKAMAGEKPTTEDLTSVLIDAKGLSPRAPSGNQSPRPGISGKNPQSPSRNIAEVKTPVKNKPINGKGRLPKSQRGNQAAGLPGKGAGRAAKFRPDRGGDALASTAHSYTRFDQSALIKGKRAARSEGLFGEAMQRMDRSGGNLSSAIKNIKSDLKKTGATRKQILEKIDGNRNYADPVKFQKYNLDYSKHYQGNQQALAKQLGDDVQQLKAKDVALMKMGVKDKGGKSLEDGPLLAEQRLKGGRFQIFDPNNGVFTYRTEGSSRKALDQYIHTAYKDKGELYPETFTRYAYHPESKQGAGAGAGGSTPGQAGSSGTGQRKSGSLGVPDTPQPKSPPRGPKTWKLDDGRIGIPMGPTRPPKFPRTGTDSAPGANPATGPSGSGRSGTSDVPAAEGIGGKGVLAGAQTSTGKKPLAPEQSGSRLAGSADSGAPPAKKLREDDSPRPGPSGMQTQWPQTAQSPGSSSSSDWGSPPVLQPFYSWPDSPSGIYDPTYAFSDIEDLGPQEESSLASGSNDGATHDISTPAAISPPDDNAPQPEMPTQATQTEPSAGAGSSPGSSRASTPDRQQPSPRPDSASGSDDPADKFSDVEDVGPVELDDIETDAIKLRPAYPAAIGDAADALYRPATGQNGVTSSAIRDAAGNQAGCFGLGMKVARMAAATPERLNLMTASTFLYSAYRRNPEMRARVLNEIEKVQQAEWNRTEHGTAGTRADSREIPGYERRLGYITGDGQKLYEALKHGFNPQTNNFGGAPKFAMISFTFKNNFLSGTNVGHVGFVERLFKNPDYLKDEYLYYDSARGGFSYANLNQLGYALRNYYGFAYKELEGFDRSYTSFYIKRP